MSLRPIHVVEDGRDPFFLATCQIIFSWQTDWVSFTHLSVHTQLCCFHALDAVNNLAVDIGHRCLSKAMIYFPVATHPEVGLLGHVEILIYFRNKIPQ